MILLVDDVSSLVGSAWVVAIDCECATWKVVRSLFPDPDGLLPDGLSNAD